MRDAFLPVDGQTQTENKTYISVYASTFIPVYADASITVTASIMGLL